MAAASKFAFQNYQHHEDLQRSVAALDAKGNGGLAARPFLKMIFVFLWVVWIMYGGLLENPSLQAFEEQLRLGQPQTVPSAWERNGKTTFGPWPDIAEAVTQHAIDGPTFLGCLLGGRGACGVAKQIPTRICCALAVPT